MKSFWTSWFPTRWTWIGIFSGAVVGLGGLLWSPLLFAGVALLSLVLVLLLIETVRLYSSQVVADGRRIMDERLSLGEDNHIELIVVAEAPFTMRAEIVDELPVQIQRRDFTLETELTSGEARTIGYLLHPVERGVYRFGAVNIFLSTGMHLVQRRFRCEADREVAVHPSVMELRRAEMMAFTQRSWQRGMHRIRRVGHTMEFEKIKSYVRGDDVRSLNWKATARTGDLMVNQFQDERSQDIYAVLDLGRVMYAPFEGMTSLDHAVNAALAFSNVALRKHDRAGLITYGAQPGTIMPARHAPDQLGHINNMLYSLDTEYAESNDEHLLSLTRRHLNQRSLLMLYTNAEAMVSLRRRIPYFRALARRHVVVVVLFENTELMRVVRTPTQTDNDIVLQTVARDIVLSKQEMVRELRHHGIYGVVAPPRELSTASINAYLDLKARGII